MNKIKFVCICGNLIKKENVTEFKCNKCNRIFKRYYDQKEHLYKWDIKK